MLPPAPLEVMHVTLEIKRLIAVVVATVVSGPPNCGNWDCSSGFLQVWWLVWDCTALGWKGNLAHKGILVSDLPFLPPLEVSTGTQSMLELARA